MEIKVQQDEACKKIFNATVTVDGKPFVAIGPSEVVAIKRAKEKAEQAALSKEK